MDVESAFKNPEHPFRVAIVCAMWLTGFDVECLSTLYIDKPMKAHTLMQAIARANRVYPGKDFGLIVDYNGMLKSLREALAQYALGDEGGGGEEIVAPIEERVKALLAAIEETEKHLRGLGFDPARLKGAKGFARIQALADAVEAVYTSDESKRRFEILARQVFIRFKALIMEPSAFAYAERHDNIEAIYKKLEERRDTADVTDLLKELHRIVNEAIRAAEPGDDRSEVEVLRPEPDRPGEAARRVREEGKRKASALQDIRQMVEDKLAQMLAQQPAADGLLQEVLGDHRRLQPRERPRHHRGDIREAGGPRQEPDAEQRRAAEEGLSEDELALFDLLKKDNLSKADRERVKLASQSLLDSVRKLIAPLERWTEKEQTQAEVETFILDHVFQELPTPPFSDDEKQTIAKLVYEHVWQQSVGETYFSASAG